MGTLRKYLIAGLLVWLPLAATVFIITLVVDMLDRIILLLPEEYRPEAVLGFTIPGFGVVLGFTILFITGVLAANLLGRRLVLLWEALLSRIPLVRTIYNSVKQITATVLTGEGRSFRKVVLAEFPRTGVWSMGFLSNEHLRIDSPRTPPELVTVFIPTTPNPTSGFIIALPRSDIIELALSIEDGFKYIISMGVIVPENAMQELCAKDNPVA